MGKVIQFPQKPREAAEARAAARDAEAKRMMTIADEIDAVILRHIDRGEVDPRDIAGLLAHRLGTLMRHLDHKSQLWDVCEKVLKAQAAIE